MSGIPGDILLRKFSLADDLYAEKIFPNGVPLDLSLLSNEDYVSLFRLVYHLIADKSPFQVRRIETIDESGLPLVDYCGGFELFKSCIIGTDEQGKVVSAVYESIANSRPSAPEEATSETKKKV